MGGQRQFVGARRIPARLLHELDTLLERRVGVIHAPAGYKKTDLVRAWFDQHPEVAAHQIQMIVHRDQQPHRISTLRAAVEDHVHAEVPVVIWIDGHERFREQGPLHEVLDLVEAQPFTRLILMGRVRPAIPLGGLAVRGELVELTDRELAYTADEVEGLLRQDGEPEDEALATFLAEARGWPMAVELACGRPLTWGHLQRVFVSIDDYIAEEVLADLGPDDLHILEGLSPMERVSLTTAERLIQRKDLGPAVARIAGRGVPLSWGPDGSVSLQPLVRRHLTRRLERDPARFYALNRAAAKALQEGGQPEAALAQALTAGDERLVFDLCARELGEAMASSATRGQELLQWLEAHLPDSPQTAIARVVVTSWHIEELQPLTGLRAIRDLLPDDATPAELARFATVALHLGRTTGYSTSIDLLAEGCDLAYALMKERIELPPMERIGLLFSFGIHELECGRPTTAQEAFRMALATSRLHGWQWGTELAMGKLALAHAMLGQTNPAQRMADDVIVAAEPNNVVSARGRSASRLARALTLLDRGQLDEAQEELDSLGTHSARGSVANTPFAHYVRASIMTDRGNHAEAIDHVQGYLAGAARHLTSFHRHILQAVLFNAQLALGDMEGAREALTAMEGESSGEDPTSIVVFRARLDLMCGRPEAAVALLRPLADAEPDSTTNTKHWLHLLITCGMACGAVGDTATSAALYQRAGVLAQRLGLDTAHARHNRSVIPVEAATVDLTKAELAALRAIACDKTLTDVAEDLFISPNTLKTHLRRVYRKLDVAGRAQAVTRAQTLGLL